MKAVCKALRIGRVPVKRPLMKPTFTLALYDIGVAYSVLGKHQDSLDAFKRLVEIEPRNAEAHLKVGLEYLSLGNKEAAIQQYHILKEFAPGPAQELYSVIHR